MKKSYYFFVLISILFSSCVSTKKYNTANAKIEELNGQVSQLNTKVGEYEKQIADLKMENEALKPAAAKWLAAQAIIAEKKENLEKALAERGTSLEELGKKAEAAVNQLKSYGCTVTYKDGRFRITVPEDYVFKSGSSSVEPKGREALNVIAQIMYDNPGLHTTIVGHTDSLPMTGGWDNWSLSTERACAVVRVLEDLYNINPKRLAAAGKGEFAPVASNDTEEGRAKNRRIEIIINPYFDRLFDLMEDESQTMN